MTNPSNAIPDPRGIASDGDLPTRRELSESNSGGRIRPPASDHTHDDDHNTDSEGGGLVVNWDEWKTKNGIIVYIDTYDENGASYQGDAIRITESGGQRTTETFRQNANGDYELIRSSTIPIKQPKPTKWYSYGNGPDSQPNPNGGWGDGIDVAMCGSTIPMYLCMRGAGGSASPTDMLTQPSETGSIMGSGDGPDLGAEAVTNTGDASWNTTDSQGHGSGGGGSGMDWRNLGDPDGPEDPNGS